VVAQETTALDDEEARQAQELVLEGLPQQSLASTRKSLRRAVTAVDPQAAERRHEVVQRDTIL
jgi:hypothetical protein